MTELWSNQKAFVERARSEKHVAAFMDPGTGKTRAAIEALREDFNLNKRIAKTLIICPLSTTKQWEKAFLAHTKIPPTQIKRFTQHGKKRAEILSRANNIIAITNFEAMRIKVFYDALLYWSPEIVIIDESHRIKNSASVTAKKIYPLAHAARRRFILTGTPVLNTLLDIFGQYKALDPTLFGGSFWKFRVKYFYDKNSRMPSHCYFPNWVPIPNAERMLSDVMAKTAVHAKKSECLDLPPLVSVPVPVELSREQKALYDKMEKEFVAELEDVTSIAEFAMTKSLRLQQIIAGFVSASSDTEPAWIENNPRLNALKEILESLEGKQVIIWTNFVPSYAKIAGVLESLGLKYSLLTGQQSTTEKEAAIASFKSGESQVIVSNPAAGGTGVDGLQVAQYAIYYTRSFNAEHFYQSRDRNHRGGSEVHDKITHYHLIAEDTVDELIFTALENKQKIGEALAFWVRKKKENVQR